MSGGYNDKQELRNTLSRALTLPDFWPGATANPRGQLRRAPAGRRCVECAGPLSTYNRGTRCNACAIKHGYQVTADTRPRCACGHVCQPRPRRAGRSRGYYSRCRACRDQPVPKHCAHCGGTIPKPRADKKYCGRPCRSAVAAQREREGRTR